MLSDLPSNVERLAWYPNRRSVWLNDPRVYDVPLLQLAGLRCCEGCCTCGGKQGGEREELGEEHRLPLSSLSYSVEGDVNWDVELGNELDEGERCGGESQIEQAGSRTVLVPSLSVASLPNVGKRRSEQ